MKLSMIAVVAASVLALSSPAMAQSLGFGAFGLYGSGSGVSNSGASNWSKAAHWGSSTANAQSQSFGNAESAFGVGVGTLPATVDPTTGVVTPGASAANAYGNFAGANVGSGSRSTAATTSNGGFSYAQTQGNGYGNTTLTGSGIGGFVTFP